MFKPKSFEEWEPEDWDRIIFGIIVTGATCFISSCLILISYAAYNDAKITQQELNKQCNTDYSVKDVFFAGDSLLALCKIKNQTVTVK